MHARHYRGHPTQRVFPPALRPLTGHTSRLHVLLVDDDLDCMAIYRDYLEYVGMQVFATQYVRSALTLAETGWPDLIICEWTVSDPESGQSIVDALHASPRSRATPRLIATTRLFPLTRIEELRTKCLRLISKPIALTLLGSTIEEVAGAQQRICS